MMHFYGWRQGAAVKFNGATSNVLSGLFYYLLHAYVLTLFFCNIPNRNISFILDSMKLANLQKQPPLHALRDC